MKAIQYLLLGLISALGLLSCYNEDDLTPSDDENIYNGEYTLPQGNHDYDADIVDMFKKYETMFLYKYNPLDIYYNFGSEKYLNGIYNEEKDSTISGMFDVPSKEVWVGEQLKLIKELWLGFYPDDFLKKHLPLKVYMVDSVFSATSGKGIPMQNLKENILTWSGTDYMLVTYGSERIQHMTSYEKYVYKVLLNVEFMKGLILPVPSEFAAVSNYKIFDNVANKSKIYENGFLGWGNSNTPQDDWMTYVTEIICTPYKDLVSETGDCNYLNPSKDTKGLIRKKYDMITKYFQTVYEVDLQKIGDYLAE